MIKISDKLHEMVLDEVASIESKSEVATFTIDRNYIEEMLLEHFDLEPGDNVEITWESGGLVSVQVERPSPVQCS